MHHGFQHVLNADAFLALTSIASLRRRPINCSICSRMRSGSADGRSILLITGMISRLWMQRQIGVGERLRFHALRRVHHQQRALAGLQAARNFVGEIDVAGRIDQVELIELPVLRAIIQAHGVGFDGDAALALQIHGVQHLRHHFALRKRAGGFQQTDRPAWTCRDRCAQ